VRRLVSGADGRLAQAPPPVSMTRGEQNDVAGRLSNAPREQKCVSREHSKAGWGAKICETGAFECTGRAKICEARAFECTAGAKIYELRCFRMHSGSKNM
jgi:hypothetical protein